MIQIDSKKIKRLPITKNIKSTRDLIKLASLVTFMIFTPYSQKQSLNHLEVLCKKGVLKHFTNFTGKHLCQSLFFNKVGNSGTGTFL